MKYDFLIVGAGFSGAVLAERLKSIKKKVLVIDRRDHIGGNCFDYHNETGVLVHKYGPHYFRTSYEHVKEYLSQFTEWIMHEYVVKACVNNELYDFPVNRNTLNKFFNVNLKTEDDARLFLEKKRIIIDPKNAEDQVLALAGKEIYEAFFKNYTIKQWGIEPKELDYTVTARIPIRTNTDDRYFTSKFQAMPKDGYSKVFERMLKDIEVRLNTDFFKVRDKIEYDYLIYTGKIDEFYDFRYGKLPYRSLQFIFEDYDKEFFQDYSQINFPNEHEYTRIVEIKHVTHQKIPCTTVVKEIPKPGIYGEPFYPLPTQPSKELFEKYKQLMNNDKKCFFLGRLAQYRYLNMDQIVWRALELFKSLKEKVLN